MKSILIMVLMALNCHAQLYPGQPEAKYMDWPKIWTFHKPIFITNDPSDPDEREPLRMPVFLLMNGKIVGPQLERPKK